jgi:hypothetical protein
MTKKNVDGAELLSCEEKPMRWYWKVLITIGILSSAYLFGAVLYILLDAAA